MCVRDSAVRTIIPGDYMIFAACLHSRCVYACSLAEMCFSIGDKDARGSLVLWLSFENYGG